MKKFILSLLTIVMFFTVLCSVTVKSAVDTITPNKEAVVQMKTAVSSTFRNDICKVPKPSSEMNVTSEPVNSVHKDDSMLVIEEPEPEGPYYHPEIPLSREEQDILGRACEEFNIPYGIALGLIEKETQFRNVIGDDGASTGYMQIQKKWHWDRMERLGVTDLLDPEGNFRVGCDFLAELYSKYGDWGVALTVYNKGHNPGYVSNYAREVLANYSDWQELVETND